MLCRSGWQGIRRRRCKRCRSNNSEPPSGCQLTLPLLRAPQRIPTWGVHPRACKSCAAAGFMVRTQGPQLLQVSRQRPPQNLNRSTIAEMLSLLPLL